MAQPVAYTRQYDFSDFSTNFPSGQQPGEQLDAEFDAIKATLDQIRTNLALIQRDDGKPANATVHPDAFTAAAIALMASASWAPRGAWAAATAYAVGDLVEDDGAAYVCAAAHTSQAALSDDRSKWVKLAPSTGAFGATLLANATAGDALDDLGVSSFVQTLLDDADGAAFRATLAVGEKHGDGSATAPALAFAGDTMTGFYRVGAGQVGFTSAGVLKVTFDATGLLVPDGAVGTPSLGFKDDVDNGFYRIGANNWGAAVAGVLALEFKSDGAVILPLQPCFLAFNSADNVNATGDGTQATVEFDSEVFDQGGNFDHSTGVFTAPQTGKFEFHASVRVSNLTASHTRGLLELVTSNRVFQLADVNIGAVRNPLNEALISGSIVVDMDAADTASVRLVISGSTKTVTIIGAATSGGGTHFSGKLAA